MNAYKKEKSNTAYVVAGSLPWNREVFEKRISKYPGRWHFISMPSQLNRKKIEKINPQYIFFLHWSWIIPSDIYENFNCVVFHMTDLPFGRGGTPLQNLLARGIYTTKISAIRVVGALDAGPVYLKASFSLKEGSAGVLYKKASEIAARMIREIVRTHPEPHP